MNRRPGRAPTARELYALEAPRADEGLDELERRFFGTLRMSNGTYKLTYSRRLDDLNAAVLPLLPAARPLRVMDVGVSSGVSTVEWSESLEEHGIDHEMTAGDIQVHSSLVSFGRHLHVLVEPSGHVLQYDLFGTAVPSPAPRRWLPVYGAGLVALRAALKCRPTGLGPGPRPVTLVSPRLLARKQIRLIEDNVVTNTTIRRQFHAVRAANLLNRSYFDDGQLAHIAANLRDRLVPGGILAVCTSTGDRYRDDEPNAPINDGSIFALRDDGRLELAGQVGAGSAIEALVLGLAPGDMNARA